MSALRTAALPVTAERGSATWRLIKAESTLCVRDKVGPLWGIGFPLLLLIILGSVPDLREPVEAGGGLTYFDLYVPVLILFNLAILATASLPTTLAGYRENGVLRRMRTTPVGPARVLTAQLVANFAIAVVAMVLFLAVAGFGFGVDLPKHLLGFALAWLLAAAALLAIGLLVTALAPGRGGGHGDRHGAVLPADVLRRTLGADLADAAAAAEHRPLHPARRGHGGVPGRVPGSLSVRRAAVDPGGLCGGVHVRRGPLVPLGIAAGNRIRGGRGSLEQEDFATAAVPSGQRGAVHTAGRSPSRSW